MTVNTVLQRDPLFCKALLEGKEWHMFADRTPEGWLLVLKRGPLELKQSQIQQNKAQIEILALELAQKQVP
jgi:hypothetical protein